jgi:hypothetical protein
MFFPQSAQSPAKAVERCLSILAPLSCSVAFESQEIIFDRFKGILQEIEQKSIDQRDQSQQLERMVPDAQARAFHRQFTFSIPKCRFNLPSSGIREKDLPGLLITADALIGDQTHTMLARTDFDHRELSGITAMGHRCPPQITRDFDTRFHVFDQLLGELFLVLSSLPQFLFLPHRIEEEMTLDPADHTFDMQRFCQRQPSKRGVCAIKDMQHQGIPFIGEMA